MSRAADPCARTGPDRPRRLAARGLGAGALAVLASLLLALPAAAPAAATTHGRAVVKVGMVPGPIGAVLVTAGGRTLYVDTHDRADHVTCTAGCARSWPPLLLARGVTKPVAGAGLKGLGTVRRPGHRLQVTWHKLPLYRFAGDARAGQARGQGVGAIFFVVTPKGVLRSTATTPTSAPGTAATEPPTTVTPAAPQSTTPTPGGTSRGGTVTPMAPSPTPSAPPATSPPVTSPPATSPPATSPPATSPPATSPPAGGGVAY